MSRTPSKHRLGVFVDRSATREADRYVYLDPVASGRRHFLTALARWQPAVVEELRKMARVDKEEDDEANLAAWANRWHLTDDWCLNYARATVQFYRAAPEGGSSYMAKSKTLCFWFNVEDAGELVTDEVRPLSPARVKKDPRHFHWLAQSHLKPGYAGRGQTRGAREHAVKRLAAFIGLTSLRPAPKGNPNIGKIGRAHSKQQRQQRERQKLLANLGR